MSILVFWILMLCGLEGTVDTNILEEHTVSTFKTLHSETLVSTSPHGVTTPKTNMDGYL
jgi:hypothetical protein